MDLFRNSCFWAPCFAWLIAQITKVILNHQRTGRVDFQYLVSLGGMPSAHSASASALATSVGLTSGFGSNLFVLALFVALVVMFDASTVRRAAGQQARILNEIIDELFHKHRMPEHRLAELLGHTRLEVLVGMLLGVIVALGLRAVVVYGLGTV